MTGAVLPAATLPMLTVRAAPAAAPAAAASGAGHFSFHELLSELNPLQYLPVVGTIYRAVTGDTIPEPVRVTGSMIVSGLTGGPLGMALNLAVLGLEKATGIDPEKIGHDLLASLGLTPDAGEGATSPATAVAAKPGQAGPSELVAATPWSPAQLAAYGIGVSEGGVLARGGLSGSDVLNDLVLAGLRDGPAPASTGTLVG